jgi:hypothetical protein
MYFPLIILSHLILSHLNSACAIFLPPPFRLKILVASPQQMPMINNSNLLSFIDFFGVLLAELT